MKNPPSSADKPSRRAFVKSALATGAFCVSIPVVAKTTKASALSDSKGFITTSAGDVFYERLGQGPDLLLLHQSAQCSEEFEQTKHYLSKSFRVLILDLPGHGKSDTPEHELSMQEYSDSIVKVLDVLRIQSIHIAGNHGGAVLTVDLATRYSNRCGRLVVFGLGRGEALDIDALVNQPMTRDLPIDVDGEFLDKTWAVYRKMSAQQTSPDTTFRPFLVSLQQRLRPFDMHHAAYRWDYMDVINDMHQPTLFVKATQDGFAGDTKALSQKVPNGQYTELPDAGVWAFYERPAACAQLIEAFIRS